MSLIPLKFTINQLIIEGYENFSLDNFSSISNEEVDPLIIYKDKPDEEMLSISKVEKETVENRFINLCFLRGDKYPYSEKVVDRNLTEKDNPRPPDQIELDDQLFVLIDTGTQRIYISNQRRKVSVLKWLQDKLSLGVSIKSIVSEEDFVKKIRTIKKLSFSVVPNLFANSSGTLSEHLVQDIYGFGADKARLEFDYNNTKLSDSLITKVNSILGQKIEYDDIVIVGRSDDEIESILNLEGITNTINIDVVPNSDSKLLDPGEVFSNLIQSIK